VAAEPAAGSTADPPTLRLEPGPLDVLAGDGMVGVWDGGVSVTLKTERDVRATGRRAGRPRPKECKLHHTYFSDTTEAWGAVEF